MYIPGGPGNQPEKYIMQHVNRKWIDRLKMIKDLLSNI
jgi:hypothetical protein